MRFTKMKKVKKECGLDTLVELPPAPDGEMLAAFAKAMRVVAAKKTFDEMSVLDIVGASGFTSRTFYNHFRSKYDLLFWSYVSEDYRALQMPGDSPMRHPEIGFTTAFAAFTMTAACSKASSSSDRGKSVCARHTLSIAAAWHATLL